MPDPWLTEPPPDWTPLQSTGVAPLEYPDGVLHDPLSGLDIPKTPRKNLEWRAAMLQRAEDDIEFREVLRSKLSRSVILFANLLGWMECMKEHLPDGGHKPTEWRHRPYISWPCQDRELVVTQRTIDEGGRIRRKKCREVGDSWMQVMVDCWMFACRPGSRILCFSAAEAEVWNGQDTDTIMGKHLYVLDPWVDEVPRLPTWLMPADPVWKKLSIKNPETKSQITGKATRGSVGRGGRADRVWGDEAAFVENLEDIERAMFENPTSLTYLSSPMPGTHFAKLATSTLYLQRVIPWYEHPEKGRGRYLKQQDDGSMRWASPWNEVRLAEMDPFMYATEVAADERFGGTLAFDVFMLDEHRRKHIDREELKIVEGSVLFARDENDAPTVTPNKMAGADAALTAGDASLFRFEPDWSPSLVRVFEDHAPHADGTGRPVFALETDPRTGTLRPPQDRRYAVACDIGEGLERANSTMSIGDVARGVKIAEVATPSYEPHDFSRLMVAICYWVGGVDRSIPLLVWERNGPGEAINKHVHKRFKYPNCWRAKTEGNLAEKTTMAMGFYSTKKNKPALISEYANGLASGLFVNPSDRALRECEGFVRKGDRIIQGINADLDSGAEAAHGDLTIADALLHMVMNHATPSQKRVAPRRSKRMTHADLEAAIERAEAYESARR